MPADGRGGREHAYADVAPELYATDGGSRIEDGPRSDGGQGSDAPESTASDSADADDHLDDLPEGAGCTEIWEHLSERREE